MTIEIQDQTSEIKGIPWKARNSGGQPSTTGWRWRAETCCKGSNSQLFNGLIRYQRTLNKRRNKELHASTWNGLRMTSRRPSATKESTVSGICESSSESSVVAWYPVRKNCSRSSRCNFYTSLWQSCADVGGRLQYGGRNSGVSWLAKRTSRNLLSPPPLLARTRAPREARSERRRTPLISTKVCKL